jgi:Lar family restriction alleviation protein
MKDKETLKPCPFCGGDEIETYESYGSLDEWDQWAVVCCANKGGCGTSSGRYDNLIDAIEAWNRRVK